MGDRWEPVSAKGEPPKHTEITVEGFKTVGDSDAYKKRAAFWEKVYQDFPLYLRNMKKSKTWKEKKPYMKLDSAEGGKKEEL